MVRIAAFESALGRLLRERVKRSRTPLPLRVPVEIHTRVRPDGVGRSVGELEVRAVRIVNFFCCDGQSLPWPALRVTPPPKTRRVDVDAARTRP